MNKWLKKWWWLLAIIALALGARTYQLKSVPAGLYYDEIDLGYQVRSLLSTGKDYRGVLSPFFTRSFNTDKTPIPIYWSFLGKLWSDPTLSTRMPTAIMGVIAVLLSMLIVLLWTKNKLAAAMVGIVAATNPWMIQFSRIAFEATYSLAFYLMFVYLWQKWLLQKKTWLFYLSLLILSLSVYTYRIMSFYVPLTVIMLGIVYFKQIKNLGWRRVMIGGVIMAGVIFPFLWATTVASADQPRIAQVSVMADTMVPILVQRAREIDSGDYKKETVGNKAIASSFVFHNKFLEWGREVKNNYLTAWSTDFLFIKGDDNLRQGVGKTGELLLIDIFGFIFGLVYLFKNFAKKSEIKWLTVWLLTSPLPSDLTIDGATHASRLIMLVGPLVIVVGLGWWQIIRTLSKLKLGKILGVGLLALWIVNLIFYGHRYLIHFPMEAARYHGYGYEQMTSDVLREQNNFDKVYLTYSYDPPMMYFLFWANIPPKQVQEYGTAFGPEVIRNQPLDKFKVMDWARLTEHKQIPQQLGEVLDPNILYVLTQSDVTLDFQPPSRVIPPGVRVVDTVYFPDNNEVAFYLLTGVKGFKPALVESDKLR